MKTRNKILSRSLIVGALVLAQSAAQAGPHWGHHHHRHHHHHRGGISVGAAVLGLTVAVPLIAMAARAERQPEVVYQPVAVPPPPPVIVQRQIEYVPAPQPSRPEPIIYPRNGQGAQQLEFDRQDCNRWATTQPAAMQDGSVYNRAVEACMDGRGYTMR